MNINVNSFISTIVVLLALAGFVTAVALGEFRLALMSVVGGLFVWFACLSFMKIKVDSLPTVVTLFGFLAGTVVFLDQAIEQDMWGGYHVLPEPALFSFVIWFLAMTPGAFLFYWKSAHPQVVSYSSVVPPEVTPAPQPVEPLDTGVEHENINTWRPEEYEVEYDPEMVEAYLEAYEDGNEEYEGE
jgi:hypothetical protein